MIRLVRSLLIGTSFVLTIGAMAQTETLSKIHAQDSDEAAIRSNLAEANSNAQVYRNALETFFVDMNNYPAYTTSTAESIGFAGAPEGTPSFKNFPDANIPADENVTLLIKAGETFLTLLSRPQFRTLRNCCLIPSPLHRGAPSPTSATNMDTWSLEPGT